MSWIQSSAPHDDETWSRSLSRIGGHVWLVNERIPNFFKKKIKNFGTCVGDMFALLAKMIQRCNCDYLIWDLQIGCVQWCVSLVSMCHLKVSGRDLTWRRYVVALNDCSSYPSCDKICILFWRYNTQLLFLHALFGSILDMDRILPPNHSKAQVRWVSPVWPGWCILLSMLFCMNADHIFFFVCASPRRFLVGTPSHAWLLSPGLCVHSNFQC